MALVRKGFEPATLKGDLLHPASDALRVARHQGQLALDAAPMGDDVGAFISAG
jgi:hypothetical protein